MNTNAHDFHYDSDLFGGSLMVRESRVVADLLLAGADDAAWKAAIMNDNCLQKARPASAKRIAQEIRKRLERLLRRSGRHCAMATTSFPLRLHSAQLRQVTCF